ncbi:recombinase family protein [Streptomyces syringium]|uniref:DNA invertase Pin-like site-specific DNA recombinase n=1 Tax=Streptomyces syringium TaxID=76729 RepID=A0ABS4Y5G7_9ACTN|nr:recombinase family protein [Streptomyces syringium]MBP2404012.1 DNA invertase Pin-like site-specific DNA recombinase [Streptomyces syringium]
MGKREEVISKLRGTPEGLPSVEEVRAMLAADPSLKCVVCYARISFDGRAKDAHGIEDQHREMTDNSRKFGWLIVYRYTDNDKSASKEEVIRDDFEQMINDLTTGQTPEGYPIHGVMAVNDDRLYRRPGDWERYLSAFTAHEDRVYHDSNGMQDLYAEGFEIKGLVGVAMSLAETRKKQRRARNSHRNRAIRGQSTAAWRPFGWDDDKVTLRPAEAAAIRQAVRDVIAGASVSEITKQWKEIGFITSRGNPFQYQTVKQVLLNARLCGYREVKGELVRDGDDQPIVGEWASIITPKEWYAVTAAIHDRGHGAGIPLGGVVHKYLLTGILRCGNTLEDGSVCNNKMIGIKANTWLKYEHAYMCKKTVDGGCNKTYKRGDKTDKHVEDLVIAKLEAQAASSNRDIPDWGKAEDLERAIQSRKQLENRWQNGDPDVDDETFFRNLPALEARVKKLRAEQAEHLAMKAAAEAAEADIVTSWKSRTLTQKRELIKKALHAVTAMPGGKGNKAFDLDLLKPVWRSSE